MIRAAQACGLLALAWLAGCASVQTAGSAEDGETVEAEGWAPLDPRDAASSRRQALAEAQKSAVEKVTGVTLAASTLVEAAVTVRRKIIAGAAGRIQRYEILSERTEGGFHKVLIRALVARRQPLNPPGNPKVSVVITGGEAGGQAAAALRERLLARGFRIAEKGARVELRGTARTYRIIEPRLGELFSYRTSITLEIVDPETGAVIASGSQESSGLGLDPESASAEAAKAAGTLLGAAVSESLTDYLWAAALL